MKTNESVDGGVIFSYMDIERKPEGWWVVKLGCTVAGGDQVKEYVRFYPHSRLAPKSARYAAHDYAWTHAPKLGLSYLC
jgi:hypothetical protein